MTDYKQFSEVPTQNTTPIQVRSDSIDSKGSRKIKVADLLINTNITSSVSPNSPGSLDKSKEEVPEDQGGKVNFIFLLWGIGGLLPWNAVLSCFDFFS